MCTTFRLHGQEHLSQILHACMKREARKWLRKMRYVLNLFSITQSCWQEKIRKWQKKCFSRAFSLRRTYTVSGAVHKPKQSQGHATRLCSIPAVVQFRYFKCARNEVTKSSVHFYKKPDARGSVRLQSVCNTQLIESENPQPGSPTIPVRSCCPLFHLK